MHAGPNVEWKRVAKIAIRKGEREIFLLFPLSVCRKKSGCGEYTQGKQQKEKERRKKNNTHAGQ